MEFTDVGILDCGCVGECLCVPPFDSDKYERDTYRTYRKIATKYGGDEAVLVGFVTTSRVHVSEGRLYFSMEFPVREVDLQGKRTVEGFVEGDLAGIMTIADNFGRLCFGTAVIDKETKRLIALLHGDDV